MVWVALAMASIALIQTPSLVNRRKWAELAGFGVVWIIATVYALLIAAEVPLPNPFELLQLFYSWFYPFVGVNS